MLKIMPRVQGDIKRLPVELRNRCRLNSADSHMLHVVEDAEQINAPEQIVRYNVRQSDGTIKKMTMFEKFIKEEILQKIEDRYQRISSKKIDI